MYFMGNVRRGEEGRERVIEALLELFKVVKGKKGRFRLMGCAQEQGKGLLMECQERWDRNARREGIGREGGNRRPRVCGGGVEGDGSIVNSSCLEDSKKVDLEGE
jgi:hypothetical protein